MLFETRFDFASYTGLTGDRGDCYSNWIFNHNLNPSILRVSGEKPKADNPIEAAFDDVYVFNTKDIYLSISGSNEFKFILVEFDGIKILEKVILKTRSGSIWNFMQDTTVATSLDGQRFKPFYKTAPSVPHGSILISDDRIRPVRTKFIRVSRDTRYLQFPEIVFIGRPEK